jgi:hypothetical protein
MSNYNKTGSSRSKLAISFAVLAVMMMLAAPVLTAVDTEATFTKDNAGYSIIMKNPTVLETEKYDAGDKVIEINAAANVFTKIFNFSAFGTPTVETDTYNITLAEGYTIEPTQQDFFMVEDLSASNVKMVYTAEEDGILMDYEFLADDYKKAANAVRNYFGNEVKEGDRLTITGKIVAREAVFYGFSYAAVDDKHSVEKDGAISIYLIFDIDVTVGLLEAGSEVGKTFTFTSDNKFMAFNSITYDYGTTKYSDVTEDTVCTVTYSDYEKAFVHGSSHYTVDGTNYNVEYTTPESGSEEVYAYIETDSEVNLNSEKASISSIPSSSGNVTVGKTYDDANNAYSEIVVQVVGQDIMDGLLLIGIAILVLVVIVIVIVIIIARKSKNR